PSRARTRALLATRPLAFETNTGEETMSIREQIRALRFPTALGLPTRLGRGGRPLRIAYGRIFHEANAYSPLVTERGDFERLHAVEGVELAKRTTLRGSEFPGYMPHAELTGFVQAARLAGGVDAVPLASFMAVPSG